MVFFVLEYRKIHFTALYCLKKSSKNGDFWTKSMGYPVWKNVNFSTFWSCCFYSIERRCFVLEYRKRHFPSVYFLKKKVGEMAIFRPKPWINPFGKFQLLDFLNFLFFLSRKAFFLEYRKKKFYCPILHKKKSSKNGLFWKKRHFPGVYCIKKRLKMTIFRPKPWINPFGKMSIFILYDFLFL